MSIQKKILKSRYAFAFATLLLLLAACTPTSTPTSEPTAETDISVDQAVALTVAAANAAPTLSVDEQVALTVAAGNVAPTLSVDEQVALTVAASGAQTSSSSSAAPTPVVDIPQEDSGLQPIQATGGDDTNSGTPQLRVNVSSANVRSGPGTVYPPISVLLKDSVVPVVAKTGNGNWYIIRLPNGELGWIANSVTDPVVAADMAQVEVAATIPPAPTSTPTNTPTSTPTATSTTAVTATATTASGTATATTTGATATPTSTPNAYSYP